VIASVGVLNWRDGLRRSDHADTRHDRSDTNVVQMRIGACTGTRRPLAFDREADDGPLVSCVDADQPACDAPGDRRRAPDPNARVGARAGIGRHGADVDHRLRRAADTEQLRTSLLTRTERP
jgi:hypothetical protein